MNARNSILSALLALGIAIEFVFDMGVRFGTWFRNGGDQQILKAVAFVITAIVWTVETIKLGAQVIYRNRVSIMEAAGRPFIYS